MFKIMKLFIVIPAYNEEQNISSVLENLKKEFPEAEIVVVDDCSADKTREKAAEKAIVLRHLINLGQGAALQTGTEYALQQGADYIAHFDADGQHRPQDLKKMVNFLEQGEVDVVLGSRFLGQGKEEIPWTKKVFILQPARFLNFFLTGLLLTDAHNGLRVLSRRAAEKISITQERMAHNTEIIAQIKKNRLKYKEMPIKVIYQDYGQNFLDGLRILKDLFWRKIF